MIRRILKENLTKALEKSGFKDIEAQVLPTTDPKFGDYYSPAALKLAKEDNKQEPAEIAKFLQAKLPKNEEIFTAEIAPNGFINFKIATKFLQSEVQKIVEKKSDYGGSEIGKGKKARIEFVSANPTGPLHIGNARGGPLGDTISNVLEASGYGVTREYYNNDIGTQVSLFVDGLIPKLKKEWEVRGPMDSYSGPFLDQLAQGLKPKLKEMGVKRLSGDVIEKIKKVAVGAVYDYIMQDIQLMGIKFDAFYHESVIRDKFTEDVLNKLKQKGVTKKKDNALWFAPNDEFLKDKEAVLIRSDGRPTYFADDIAYHNLKYGDGSNGANLIINVLGSNHHSHVSRLKAAIKALDKDIGKFKPILYQFVRVKRGKEVVRMSKRSGDFVTARGLLNEVGKDAFRFYLLMFDPSTHMDFDLERAKKQSSNNPVYYVQYAHARCNSVLKTAQKEGLSLSNISKSNIGLLNEPEEIVLMKHLIKLPEILEDISENFAVHLLTAYTIGLADRFHRYYERVRIIGKDPQETMARLALITATKTVLHNSLQLMGISAPEHMESKDDESKSS